jgi:PIN domain
MQTSYVILDTNILFRFITQGQPGCEPEHWEELKKCAGHLTVRLLASEVVSLELENKVRNLKDDMTGKIGGVGEKLKTIRDGLWNELGDLVFFLETQLREWKRKKIEDVQDRLDEVQRFLMWDHVTLLPFDQDIMFRAKRRMLAGRVKTSKDRADADCFIVESLVRFFEERRGEDQLLLCTENHKEFGVETSEGTKTLHPLLKEGLPPTQLFTNLATLVGFIKDQRAVQEPAPEELKEALDREEAENIEEAIIGAIASELSPAKETIATIDPATLLRFKDTLRISESLLAARAFHTIDPAKLSRFSDTLLKQAVTLARTMSDLSHIWAMQKSMASKTKLAMPDLSHIRAMEESLDSMTKLAMPNLSNIRAMQESMVLAMPDLSKIREIQESMASMTKLAMPDLSKIREIQESMASMTKLAMPDLQAVQEVMGRIGVLRATIPSLPMSTSDEETVNSTNAVEEKGDAQKGGDRQDRYES